MLTTWCVKCYFLGIASPVLSRFDTNTRAEYWLHCLIPGNFSCPMGLSFFSCRHVCEGAHWVDFSPVLGISIAHINQQHLYYRRRLYNHNRCYLYCGIPVVSPSMPDACHPLYMWIKGVIMLVKENSKVSIPVVCSHLSATSGGRRYSTYQAFQSRKW